MNAMLKPHFLRVQLLDDHDRLAAIAQCVALLDDVSVQIHRVAEDGSLLLLQDIASCMVTTWAHTVYEVCRFWHIAKSHTTVILVSFSEPETPGYQHGQTYLPALHG